MPKPRACSLYADYFSAMLDGRRINVMDSVMPECRHCFHYAFLPPARSVLSCRRLRHRGGNPITWPITILRSAHYIQSLPFQGKKCLLRSPLKKATHSENKKPLAHLLNPLTHS